MICILHGYLLEGSGSNLWTRSIAQSLCRDGQDVHLVCQENHPEIYDFIAEVRLYRTDGSVETLLERDTPYEGRCVMHKPRLGDTLPVYVWDRYEEFPDPVPMVELPDAVIEEYLERNVRVVRRVVAENGITAMHANHAVLMSVVAERVGTDAGIPFAIMPHGSAIEYAVKKDARFHRYASEAFSAAARIFVIGDEMRERVTTVFPEVDGLMEKLRGLNLGVDTALFEPVEHDDRPASVKGLVRRVRERERGKTRQQSDELLGDLSGSLTREELTALIGSTSKYDAKRPDADVEEKLEAVAWRTDDVLLFVGRLIASKGIQSVLAALPTILAARPDTRLVVVGHGPLREPMEALAHALGTGNRALARHIVEWGTALEGSTPRPLREVQAYWEELEKEGRLEEYFRVAEERMTRDRVIFTGYLTHSELRYLFPLADVAIFPSVVAEAGPLVFLEALASGCFPLGTYFAGMAASIDSVADGLPDEDAEWMKLDPDPEQTVKDIARNVPGALSLGGRHRTELRRIAVERYDWRSVGRRMVEELEGAVR